MSVWDHTRQTLTLAGALPPVKVRRKLALNYVHGLYAADVELLGTPMWFGFVFERVTPPTRNDEGRMVAGFAEYSTLCLTGGSSEEVTHKLRAKVGDAFCVVRPRMVLVHYDGAALFRVFINGEEVRA